MSDKWEIGGDVALQRFVLDKFGSLLRLVSKVVTASSSSSKLEESILLKIGDRCNILVAMREQMRELFRIALQPVDSN